MSKPLVLALATALAAWSAPASAAIKASDVVGRAIDGFVRPAYALLREGAAATKKDVEALCKNPSQAHLDAGDQRHTILPFRPDVWPAVHAGVERLKALAAANGLPLAALAIRWLLAQPHINSVVVGARDRAQSQANAAILDDGVSPAVLHEATKISDEAASHIPDVGNLFDYYP